MKRALLVLSTAAVLAPGCHNGPAKRGELPAVTAPAAPARGALVVTHGGQGSEAALSDGPATAASAALGSLGKGNGALEAAMAAVEVMENDPRFNAGQGANVRLDGVTIECDAAVMDDEGRFGSVASLTRWSNPVRVAHAVSMTPHRMLAGEGANRFAQVLGFQSADLKTAGATAKLERNWSLVQDPPTGGEWDGFDWQKAWNFPGPLPAANDAPQAPSEGAPDSAAPAVADTKDTVGAVVRTADGHFAAALSTGGTTLALRGRVGDVPQQGAGLFAGPHGAVAATGKGEAILREMVALRVYDLMAAGVSPDAAIRRATRDISAAEGVGVVAVSRAGFGARATSQMAWASADADGTLRGDEVVW